MRSKARQILSSVRQQMLFIIFCIFGSILISVKAEDVTSETPENNGSSQIYYVTIPIDRSNGPFLRQLKILIPNVPSPYSDTKNYDGDTWESFVDKLLIKKDSVQRSGRTKTDVMVPLPAACFDTALSAEKKDQCLKDPKGFARGFISMKLYDVKSGETLNDIFSRHGVYPTRDGSPYYNQQRWPDVVQNFNPRIRQWNHLPEGAVFILPVVHESGSRAQQAVPASTESNLAKDNVTESSVLTGGVNSSQAEKQPEKIDPQTEAASGPKPGSPDESNTGSQTESQLSSVLGPKPEVGASMPPLPEAPATVGVEQKPQASKPGMKDSKPQDAVEGPHEKPKSVETAKENAVIPAAQSKPEQSPPQSPQVANVSVSSEPTSDLSIGWCRNVLSSAKIPMVAKQNSLNLTYTKSEPASSSDRWFGINHMPKVTSKSGSKYLIETDDPNEFFTMSSVDYGARFHLRGFVPNWSVFAGVYLRLISLNIRMYIDNESDEATYLLERNTRSNVGLGLNAGIDHAVGSRTYRLNIIKDLYEFVDNSAQIDRTSARFTTAFKFPEIKAQGKVQRHLDLIVESETINVNVVSETVLLQGTLKRFSFGVGAGLVW